MGLMEIRQSEKRVAVEGRIAMLRSLHKRLQKLESGLCAELDKEKEFTVYFALFLLQAFGYYFGDPKPNEAPGAATAQALGHEHEGQFNQAIKKGSNPELDEKYARANCQQLFAKFGVDVGIADGQEIANAAKRIYAGLPVSYRAETRVKPVHDNFWLCRPLDLPKAGRMSRKSRVFTLDVRRHFDHDSWSCQFIDFIDENGGGLSPQDCGLQP
jgi:hypothetical protein